MRRSGLQDGLSIIDEDHRRVREILDELRPEDPGDFPDRKVVEHLVVEESRHEVAEEIWMWPLARDITHAPGLAARGLNQEFHAKRLLSRLRHLPTETAEANALLERVQYALREHMLYEEREILPLIRLGMDEELSVQVGKLITAARASAPTRPRPYMPAWPGLLRASAPLVGRLDRARDLAQRRGR